MKKQLILVADMEGASGIFHDDTEAIRHSTPRWREYGRSCITSDVLAVCDAAIEFGIDEILLYDMHYAGSEESNICLEDLPGIIRPFDVPDRKFLWRRIRGQSQIDPVGLITIGQHARFGEPHAYFPHTIQSPPIKSVYFNDIHIAEIGQAVLSFHGVRYLANIGCAASMKEAKELCSGVAEIPVKDLKKDWEPTPKETSLAIKDGVFKALTKAGDCLRTAFSYPFRFSMNLSEGYFFDAPEQFPWVGQFEHQSSEWLAPNIEIGLEIFGFVRSFIKKSDA